jgi:exonuclease SbcC
VQRLIDINSGKQEIISTQIIAEEEKYSEDSKFALAEERNEQLITLLDFVEKSTVWIEEAQSLIQIDEREEHALESILPGYAFDLAGKKAALVVDQEELDKLNAELPKIEAKFSKTQKTIADKKALLQESIPKIRASINEAEKIKADIEKQLHGVIECPACHHHFTIGDQTFTWEEANGELKDTTELIVDLTKDLQADEKALAETLTEEKELIQKIADAQKGQREKIKVKEAVVDQIHTDIRTIEADIRKDTNAKNALTDKVERARREVTKTEQLIEEKLKEAEDIEAAIAQIKDGKSDKLTEMEANLLTVVDEGSELQEKLQAAMDVVRKKEEWNTNFKNFKSFLANQSIKTIEDYTNMYLQKMGTNLSIAIQGYRLLSSKKLKEEISITVLRNGLEEASYGTFSGGERARIDIAVILSIQELINLNSTSGGIDLLFIDEVLDSVDSLGMQHIIEGLKNVGKTVLIVSQVEINSLAEDTLIIQKKDKISRII